jgi:hypothetical protein
LVVQGRRVRRSRLRDEGHRAAEAGAILMGRVSYDEFAPVWHTMAEFESYNAGEKYVVSTTLDGDTAPMGGLRPRASAPLDRRRACAQGGRRRPHPRPRQRDARAGAGPGGPRRPLPPLVFPLLLGSGKRLFGTTDHKQKLQVIDTETYGNGSPRSSTTSPDEPRPDQTPSSVPRKPACRRRGSPWRGHSQNNPSPVASRQLRAWTASERRHRRSLPPSRGGLDLALPTGRLAERPGRLRR